MKKIKFLLISFTFSFSCSTTDELKLKKEEFQKFSDKNKIIEISLLSFPKMKTEIYIELQSIEYFSEDSYRFGSKYSFSEEIIGDKINIEIPNGKFVGSIQVKISKTVPFYKNYFGIHTIYFGMNEKRIKEKFSNGKCSSEYSFSIKLAKSSKYNNYCDDLDVENKKYILKFLTNDKTEFNPSRTLALAYAGVSIGLTKSFTNYPYVPFLLLTSYFGFFLNDVEISSEIQQESL
ncbi:hypothetical protein ND810_18960 [Leptospira levettii]|uniref:Lipoprotein n=1 Tax=Leptospira levettii TaxID=2023178 RepID=A0AAW5V6I9_9LEPT|nr:hypothetical protein [Leptospira levettii]MCW7517256.1 hypothetical protein [Leptospira levettii]